MATKAQTFFGKTEPLPAPPPREKKERRQPAFHTDVPPSQQKAVEQDVQSPLAVLPGFVITVRGTASPLYGFNGMIQIYPTRECAGDVVRDMESMGSCANLTPIEVRPVEIRIMR